MTSNSVNRLLLQAGGLFLLANGVMGLLRPRWHALPWRFGPQLARAVTEEIADNRTTARTIYLAQAAIAVAMLRESMDND